MRHPEDLHAMILPYNHLLMLSDATPGSYPIIQRKYMILVYILLYGFKRTEDGAGVPGICHSGLFSCLPDHRGRCKQFSYLFGKPFRRYLKGSSFLVESTDKRKVFHMRSAENRLAPQGRFKRILAT